MKEQDKKNNYEIHQEVYGIPWEDLCLKCLECRGNYRDRLNDPHCREKYAQYYEELKRELPVAPVTPSSSYIMGRQQQAAGLGVSVRQNTNIIKEFHEKNHPSGLYRAIDFDSHGTPFELPSSLDYFKHHYADVVKETKLNNLKGSITLGPDFKIDIEK